MDRKPQLIDGILRINPTTNQEWLERFEAPALSRYLDHLQHALEPRGRESYWLRTGETPAVVTRRPAA